MKALLVTLAALNGLFGCATNLDPQIQASLDSWIGAPVVEFFAQHREPDSTVDKTEYHVYVWDRTRRTKYTTPVTRTCAREPNEGTGRMEQNCTSWGGQPAISTTQCAWKLRVRDDVITQAELVGDACNADERPKPRPVR